MRHDWYEFTWQRPTGGVVLTQGISSNEGTKEQCFIVPTNYRSWERYDGNVSEARGFRKTLLETAPTNDEAILDCVERYGFLHAPSRYHPSDVLPEYHQNVRGLDEFQDSSGNELEGEPIDHWRRCIVEHRVVEGYWDGLVNDGGFEQMEEEWEEFGRRFDTWDFIEVGEYLDPFTSNLFARPESRVRSWDKLLNFVNYRLQKVAGRLERDGRECSLHVEPVDLETFSWLLLANELSAGREPMRCEYCKNRFRPHPRAKPGHMRFCKDSCKVMQSRKRKKARSLHAEGRAIRRIANQIGVQEKLVRSWLN